MSEEPPREVPEQIDEWLTELAADRGISEEELVAQLLATDGVDLVSTTDDGDEVDERLEDLEADFQRRLDERLDGLESDVRQRFDARLEELEGDFGEKLEDVRSRVVQVKREADAKAPEEHGHEELEATIDRTTEQVAELRTEIEGLEDRLEEGFENYEEVLEYLVDTTEAIEGDLDTVAGAVEELREETAELARARANRVAVERLARSANEQGTSRAKCDECAEAVDIGLLTEPRCPHCQAVFTSVDGGGFFRSSVLETGTLPALDESERADDDRLVGDHESSGGDRPERVATDGASGFAFDADGDGLAPEPEADGGNPEESGTSEGASRPFDE